MDFLELKHSLHLQGRKISQAVNRYEAGNKALLDDFQRTTRCYVPEHQTLHKCMLTARQQNHNIKIASRAFENVTNSKYWGQ
jgi:hypothetical protein